jgi:hypothetical protein
MRTRQRSIFRRRFEPRQRPAGKGETARFGKHRCAIRGRHGCDFGGALAVEPDAVGVGLEKRVAARLTLAVAVGKFVAVAERRIYPGGRVENAWGVNALPIAAASIAIGW